MSKTALSIKMLEILYSRDIVSIAELATQLETNPRNIPEYKKALEEAGYYIETIPGRNGGYRLHKTTLFPSVGLTETEKRALVDSYDYMIARNDFMPIVAYNNAMIKMLSKNIHGEVSDRDITVITRFPLNISDGELQKRYTSINECIQEKQVINIDYRSNDNIIRNRNVRPHKLYMFDNEWFFIAFCELVNDYRYFKLSRIVEYKKENRRFRVLYGYDEKELLNKFGMTKNGDWYDIKLKFKGRYATIVQDYIYGQEQTIEQQEDGSVILSVRMQYRNNIINFALFAGVECEVIEPEWLKAEIVNQCKQIQKIYKMHHDQ